MKTEGKKKRSGSLPSALLLGIIFGVILVMLQELLYQRRLMARYEANAGYDNVVVIESDTASDREETTVNAGAKKDDAPSAPTSPLDSMADNETSATEDDVQSDETEEDAVRTGPAAVYDFDQETGGTTIELDGFAITLDFPGLYAANSDFIGWLVIPNSNISFPVVQGSDNGFYLKHAFNGTYSDLGAIFADYRSSVFKDENTIIYGHNWKRDTIMFSELVHYAEQEYYDGHSAAYFLTEEECFRIDIFSAYEASTSDIIYTPTFVTGEEYSAFLNHLKEMSAVSCAVEVGETDRIVTLSTCSNTDSNGRFVVAGRLTRLTFAQTSSN